METITETSGSQLWKKEHIEPILFHFIRQQSTAASGDSSFFNWNICFSQSFIPASENEFFVYWKQYCFTLEFFLLVETIVEIWRKSIFKDETYSCWWTQAFSIFSETLRCFKVEATFPFSGNAFFNKSYIWLLEMDTFCLVETVLFDQSYFSASGSHYWN